MTPFLKAHSRFSRVLSGARGAPSGVLRCVSAAFLLASCLLMTTAGSANASVLDSSQVTDDAIREQLSRDRTLLPMGKGAVFVPYLVDPQLEPAFSIYMGDSFITDAEPGKRIPLDPGIYELFIGSGPMDLRIQVRVKVHEERVSVVEPVWSSLMVQIYDRNNNPLRIGYQIFNENTKIFIAAGTGVDEILGEKQIVWILRPDLYRVTKRGESPDSLKNFLTIRTMPGKHSTVGLIFDEITTQLVGGGEFLEDMSDPAQRGNWSFTASMAGNFSFINEGFFRSDELDVNNYTMRTTFSGRLTYEDHKYIFLNRADIYENFQKPDSDRFRFTRDLVHLESALIYRINPNFGPYVSLRLRTNFFNRHYQVSKDPSVDTFFQRSSGEDATMGERLEPGSYFRYSGPFSPVSLTQSAGLNFSKRYTNLFQMNLRTGWGFRQDLASYLYDISLGDRPVLNEDGEPTGRKEKIIPRVPRFQYSYGPEVTAIVTLTPLPFLEIKEEFEALIPVANTNNVNYLSTTITSLWLSQFASLQYEFLLERNPSISQSIKKIHTLTLQLFFRII